MKKHFFAVLLLIVMSASVINAQESGYKFKDIKRLPTTSVKDQYASGTCWSFSTISFIESEMMRMGVKKADMPDLSEMFVVWHCYHAKADKFMRMHGELNFGGGGSFYDVLWVCKNFGMVPENVYKGLNYGTEKHNHQEFDKVLKNIVDGLKESKSMTSRAWLSAFDGVLNAYLGDLPTDFTYKGKKYTPKSFANEVVKINPDDYVSITSYSHHPFYTQFAIEVPDNWQWSLSYNVPVDDLTAIADNAIKNGYSIAWGADVSEVYFSYKDGVAVVPDLDIKELVQTERSRWEKVDREKYNLSEPGKEKTITQDMRQNDYDNWRTTDDHGMHIVGLAKDQNGEEYYIVKNSWNTNNIYEGYLYVSKAYFKYKTMNFVIHKDAVPSNIKSKLGL